MIRNGRSKRTPCPTCNAKTEKQAEKMCRPTSNMDGSYDCVGAYMSVDIRGYFTNGSFPTQQDSEQI